MKLMRYRKTLLLGLLTLLSSCASTYRYPCQDPSKSNTAECSCSNGQPRTKNKALGVVETAPTTTLGLVGFDC